MPNIKFDYNISVGNLLSILTVIIAVLSAYFDILQDVKLLTSAHAHQREVVDIQYRNIIQEIQELKIHIQKLQERVAVNNRTAP